uniref:C1q domain-containing protein n=1 Tax=Neogobius melanostomus TaxID=47308 RepID=A0A8C6SFJ9_9GOBI
MFSPPGLAGARGLPGASGSKGPAGATGDKGNMGVNGRDGAEGLKGPQGEPGPCLKGDQGDTGAPGPMGDPGYPGMPGPCTLAVQSAFSVGLGTPFPAPDRPVRFTKVLYNVQGHYNLALGIFIAPVNGIYVFSFHLTVKDKVLIAGLFHNFYPVFKITDVNQLATASQKVVLHLSENDLIWVQVKDNNNNGMYVDREVSSTFTGFLLSPDECYLSLDRSFTGTPNITIPNRDYVV